MFALPVILGLCITCLGNIKADARDQIVPYNAIPEFFQHAYSEKKAMRQIEEVPTGQGIIEDQSGQKTNDQHFKIEPRIADSTHHDTVNYNLKHTNRKINSARVKRIIPRDRFLELRGVAFAFGSKRVRIENPSMMQWHVGIYTKTTTPYMQICGGTLVTLNTVISAAHCFWVDDKLLSVDQFAVGAGKHHRPWSDTHDIHSQTSDVTAIHTPPRYRGSLTNYQDDIALVKLTLTLKQTLAVLPACVSFDEGLDEEQLGSRTPGTVMGWGLTQQDGRPSQVLNYVELPPLPLDECFKQAGPDFIQFITSDKICAGVAGQGLCLGDSGGGLVFVDDDSFPSVPYLRGVASTAPRNEHACNTATFTAFTQVMGWGLTQQDGLPSQVLKYVELPPVPLDKCYEQAGPDFIRYIISDKICAGIAGQALCTGDSGGGLVFIENSSLPVPYLRGVASSAPRSQDDCNAAAVINAFTYVLHHRLFLLKQVPQLERDCQNRYPTARVENKN